MFKIVGFALLVVLLFSCGEETDQFSDHFHLECSGENVSDNQFIEGKEVLSNASCRSNQASRTGSYGFKLNRDKPFGPTFKLKEIKKGNAIYASVWRLKGATMGKLVISSNDNVQFEFSEHVVRREGGWELMKCQFIAKKDHDFVDVYIWNPGESDVFFDDLVIDCFRSTSKAHALSEEDVLRIYIPDSALDSIESFRTKALKQEVISSELKTYFNAHIDIEGKKCPVQLRLKGDWTDHLEGDKWSFRIKCSDDNTYQGIKKFSIQDPSTRSFMMEWIAHKLFEREDILTTRYQFKQVYINGENKGVYALEEHFDKRLLENRNRREGPIVKFDESGIWQARLYQKQTGTPFKEYPFLESAEILPFSKNRTRKSATLLKQFRMAKSHMERFRNYDEAIEDYLDLERMAKFLAICEVLNAKHGLVWPNQRHYLNPVTCKLEPIAYDCYSTTVHLNKELIGLGLKNKQNKDLTIIDALFRNEGFKNKYLFYVKSFSKEAYLQQVFDDFQEELDHNMALLSPEYPLFTLDLDYLKYNQAWVNKEALNYKESQFEHRNFQSLIDYNRVKCDVIFDKAALKICTIAADSTRSVLQCENFLLSDIELVGYSTKKNKKIVRPFPNSIKLSRFDKKPDKQIVSIAEKAYKIYYRSSCSGDSLLSAKVSKFPPFEWISPVNNSFKVLHGNYSDDTIVFSKGMYSYTESVVVPAEKVVVIEAGARIELKNNARFISYSPVLMNGTKENPITFYSKDKKGGCLVILPNGGEVTMSHVQFKGLSSGNDKVEWVLTGAVTIYEADVSMSNCSFDKNYSEDALNLIRCSFQMKDCAISNTLSDGFDADFCSGTLTNSTFTNTGNDCIDFSGSSIEITSCQINGSGDKGISGGERSSLIVENCTINNAIIAVASKDNSTVKVSNCEITNCENAYASYQKKTEYGPSSLFAENNSLKAIKSVQLVELNSIISINGSKTVGKKAFDIDSMYAKFQKIQ